MMDWFDVARAVWDIVYQILSTCEDCVERLPTAAQCMLDWC